MSQRWAIADEQRLVGELLKSVNTSRLPYSNVWQGVR
jgi:hypothetical protein